MRFPSETRLTRDRIYRRRPDDSESSLGALVLECTDMPPFAQRIQQAVGLPVFDLTTLTELVFECVVRRAYRGLAER